MKKIIRIIGNSKGVIFNKEELEINDLDDGDIIDFTIIKLNKSKKK